MKTSDNTRDINRHFKLSKDLTSKLHKASKAHGVTVTNVASAFIALAFTESLLKGAAKAGEERFKTVYGGYNNSTHFILPMNFVDQVRMHIFLLNEQSLSDYRLHPRPSLSYKSLMVFLPNVSRHLFGKPSRIMLSLALLAQHLMVLIAAIIYLFLELRRASCGHSFSLANLKMYPLCAPITMTIYIFSSHYILHRISLNHLGMLN